MRKALKKFITWVMTSKDRELEEKLAYSRQDVAVEEAVAKPQPKVRVAMMEVMNGKLLEVATYQRSSHGPDWKTEYYILEEGRPLAEQIAVVMTMRGMGV
jgi:hypothetical protein